MSGNDPATGSTAQLFSKVLDYASWILPTLMLVASVVIFFVKYKQYEKQKDVDAKRISRQISKQDTDELDRPMKK